MIETKVKFISSTNQYMENVFKDMEGSIRIDTNNNIVYFKNSPSAVFHTSMVKDFIQKDKTLTFHTLNSTYVFELSVLETIDFKVENNADKVLMLEFLNKSITDTFYCKIAGNPLIDGAYSVIVLKDKMTMKEADKLLASTPLQDVEGNMVTRILLPKTDKYISEGNMEVIIENETEYIPVDSINDEKIKNIITKHFNKNMISVDEWNLFIKNKFL
jgi:hypothetical protein